MWGLKLKQILKKSEDVCKLISDILPLRDDESGTGSKSPMRRIGALQTHCLTRSRVRPQLRGFSLVQESTMCRPPFGEKITSFLLCLVE